MSDNAEKLWFQDSLNRVAIARASDAIERLGAALPCRVVAVSGSIVTVTFEVNSQWTLPNVTLPKAEGPWIRSPTQVGDYGLTVPADAYLGGISGLGGGVATMTQRGNLTALVWVPVAATGFSGVNVNAAYVSGPQGAVIQDEAGHNIAVISSDGTITLTAATVIALNAPTIQLNGEITQGAGTLGSAATFIGPITVTNNVTAAGISLQTHVHSGVTTGGGDTGAPV
ncbi:MAG: hypothetical protein ACYC3L_00960 [Gemmatimonadaceae bacterium]